MDTYVIHCDLPQRNTKQAMSVDAGTHVCDSSPSTSASSAHLIRYDTKSGMTRMQIGDELSKGHVIYLWDVQC